MKSGACPDPIAALVVLPEPAAQDLLNLIVWQQPTNRTWSHQAQTQATAAELLYKGVTG